LTQSADTFVRADDGKPLDDGTSYGSYHGALHNLRPNHDFLEDKLWFEMAETHPLPETLKNIYQDFLSNDTYWTPAGRSNFIRPVSLSSASSLDRLEDNIRPRMERSKRFRPSQWNIADEYGWCAQSVDTTPVPCSRLPQSV
jgi:hypothetical protein